MSSAEYLREFVNQRLKAAAEEIFKVFNTTVVQYEEEIERQRTLLDMCWKPEVRLQRIERPQQHVHTEQEVQQLYNQERNSSLVPEPPLIKEEEEEVCVNQEVEQVVLKQDAFISSLTCEERDHSLDLQHPELLQIREEEPCTSQGGEQFLLKQETDTFMLLPYEGSDDSEPETDNWDVAENYHHTGEEHGRDNSRNSQSTSTGKKYFQCDTCGKILKYESRLIIHLRSHTGEKLYSCKICGKEFKQNGVLTRHMRIHTDEKPFLCKICGKGFVQMSNLKRHSRTHTGEKPFSCQLCSKRYRFDSTLKWHMRKHTGEKPYLCNTCGKAFTSWSELTVHMRRHTGEKPYLCTICGKRFYLASLLKNHMRNHTG
ncbi:zinc finger protein ZFP2-like [Antennarius striatus]|uniref:zinc finger protein ZFP2-like n=1 Tax=Antennarius striatus TaxID=241820 RepID=UPI0035B01579